MRWLGSPLGLLALCALDVLFFLPSVQRHPAPVLGRRIRLRDSASARATGIAVVAAAIVADSRLLAGRPDRTRELMVRLRSPLGRVLGLGSAKSGYGHWWGQRLSAAALVPLGLWFLLSMPGLSGADYGTVTAWVERAAHAILLILLLADVALSLQPRSAGGRRGLRASRGLKGDQSGVDQVRAHRARGGGRLRGRRLLSAGSPA